MSSIFIPNKCPVKIMSLTNFNKQNNLMHLFNRSISETVIHVVVHTSPNSNTELKWTNRLQQKKHQSDKTHKAAKKNKLLLDKIRTTKTVHTVFLGIYSPLKLTASSPLEKKIPECHDERVEGFCGENFREGKITQYDCWGMSFIYFNRWYKVGPQKQLQVGLYITPIRLGV